MMKLSKRALFMFGMLAYVIIAGTVNLSGELLKLACEAGILSGMICAAMMEKWKPNC